MPAITPLVDVEALAVDHLLADPTVTALVDDRVSTELPHEATLPYVQLFRLGGNLITQETAWLERSRLFLASWAPTKAEAFDVSNAAIVSLMATPDVTHAAGVVTAADIELAPYWSPDPEDDQPRYLSTVALTVHPDPDGSV